MEIGNLAGYVNAGQLLLFIGWLFWYFKDRGEIRERLVAIETTLKDQWRKR